ncbi:MULTISPECIES: DUF6843 domain-containing protein [Paenibacillus]|uniref:DUF6843 domain-containing protein n=1 Tax=Paenibacillus TaxID=44249 RepID=UPI0021F0E407|nr:hypothetical protein [Paenibacillus sp. PSB04]UYO02460.1 hypothetical protein K2F33_22235 [Paenibacillus sp. PSB04]
MKKLLFVAALLTITMTANACSIRTPNVILIPEGYVGWVQIIYSQPDGEKFEKRGGKNIIHISNNGIYEASALEPEYGTATDEYYYVDDNGNRKKIDMEELIHNHTIGEGSFHDNNSSKLYPKVEKFFVGTEEEAKKVPVPEYPGDLEPIN